MSTQNEITTDTDADTDTDWDWVGDQQDIGADLHASGRTVGWCENSEQVEGWSEAQALQESIDDSWQRMDALTR